jgi:hypothetical protein
MKGKTAMKQLFFKELKLALLPLNLIFMLLAFIILIPNYPYVTSFIYVPIGLVQLFTLGRENNEMYYASLLPVRKKDLVTSRFLLVTLLELIQILLSIPLLYLNAYIGIANQAGNQANYALLGEGLFMYGIFNLVFLTSFYKTGVRIGLPFFFAFSLMIICGETADIILAFFAPFRSLINQSVNLASAYQYLVCAIGLICFLLFTLLSYLRSLKEVERIEL